MFLVIDSTNDNHVFLPDDPRHDPNFPIGTPVEEDVIFHVLKVGKWSDGAARKLPVLGRDRIARQTYRLFEAERDLDPIAYDRMCPGTSVYSFDTWQQYRRTILQLGIQQPPTHCGLGCDDCFS